jgi:hypothetical protein
VDFGVACSLCGSSVGGATGMMLDGHVGSRVAGVMNDASLSSLIFKSPNTDKSIVYPNTHLWRHRKLKNLKKNSIFKI